MTSFVYEGLPGRVLFGWGISSQTPDEVKALGCSRALVLSTPEQHHSAERFAAALGPACVGVFSEAAMHTPLGVTERAVAEVRDRSADCVVSVGGGSTIGLGKAIALRTDLPQVVIATTYAGSEMTPVIGETVEDKKTTQRTMRVLPETVIYDVELTLTLPPAASAASGVNAMAHAIEALYAPAANPVTSLLAGESVRLLARALPAIVDDPSNRDARAKALRGSWLAGMCLATTGMALHHKLCHILGGTFGLPHAATHAVVLPHAVAYNAGAAPQAMAVLADALGEADPAAGMYRMLEELGLERSLAALGMPHDAVEKAAQAAVREPYPNPAPLEQDRIARLLAAAWEGKPPNV